LFRSREEKMTEMEAWLAKPRFVLRRRIGKGGFGSVFEAFDTQRKRVGGRARGFPRQIAL
jgi:hypothetical protein